MRPREGATVCYSITDVHDLHALATAVRKLASVHDARLLSVKTCESVVDLTGFDFAALALVDEPGSMRVVASTGLPRPVVGERILEGAGLGGNALRAGESLLIDDEVAIDTNTLLGGPQANPVFARLLPEGTAYEAFLAGANAAAAQPVTYGGTVIAVLYAGYDDGRSHDHTPLAMLSEFSAFLGPLLISVTHLGQLEQTVRADERQQMIQHLHDTSLQLLFGIRLTAQTLLETDLDQSQRTKVEEIESTSASAAQFLRETIQDTLREDRNLVVATQRFVDAFTHRSAVPAQLVVLGQPRELDTEVERLVVSAVREFLHNIEKHAGATSVAVSLTYREATFVVVVQDDGVGVPQDFRPPAIPNANCGLGIANVLQSASLLSGTVTWERNEDGGTTARIEVPTSATPMPIDFAGVTKAPPIAGALRGLEKAV